MFKDFSEPSIAGLAHLLRHPELDPEGFQFNYFNCNACAMGLATQRWSLPIDPTAKTIAPKLGMEEIDAYRIFMSRTPAEGYSREAIARDLETLLV